MLYLRLTFFGLAILCLLQIAREIGGMLPGCVPEYYASEGKSSNLRPLNLDAPLDISKMDPIPKFETNPLFKQEQDRIDAIDDASRCARYGVETLPDDQKHSRRIFFGAMVADENPEVILAHSTEVYNKFSVVALVESNTTHSGRPREMNYGPGSRNARTLQESEMFGTAENTKVVLDYWLEDMPDVVGMTREVEQRNTIWKIWVDQGMREHDVGIMADLDEVVSRDFLNAVQVCDFPKLRYDPDNRPSCQIPKIILSTMQFEVSPLCIKDGEWFHPDIIIGACLVGVGDPSGRVTPERDMKTIGHRTDEWGAADYHKYPQDVIDNNRFPLWDGRDIREVNGSDEALLNFKDKDENGHGKTAVFGTAYHLHNWFKDMEVLRHKFATYGHFHDDAKTIPLSKIGEDIDIAVRCVRGIGNVEATEEMQNPRPYYENNTLLPEGEKELFSLKGNRPIFFKDRTYVEQRHALVQEMVRADEAKYGTIYENEKR